MSQKYSSLYEILEVSPNASLDELTEAYRKKAQMYHPDKVTHLAPELRDLAERRMKEINNAYIQLKQRISAKDNAALISKPLRQINILQGHEDTIDGLAFSSDGQRIFSGSDDGTIKVWDINSGYEIYCFECGFEAEGRLFLSSVLFAPESDRAFCIFSSSAWLFDLRKGQIIQAIDLDHSPNCAAISRDGHQAITGAIDGTLYLWDLDKGKQIHDFRGGHTSATEPYPNLEKVAFSYDKCLAATSADDGTFRVWDVRSGREVRQFKGYGIGIAISHDNRQILIGLRGEPLKILDIETGDEVCSLYGHTDNVLCITFSQDGKRAISGSVDQTARIWDLEYGHELYQLTDHAEHVNHVAFAPNGRYVITADSKKNIVRLWQIPS